MPIQKVHIARENARRYPWAREIVDGWRRDVAYALQQERSFFEQMIPILTPWPEYGQNCPACVGRLSAMGETGLYEWDVRDPERLVCKYCKTEYPNADYPETGQLVASAMGQTFSYYLNDSERAHPEDTSGTHAYRWVTFPVHTSWSGVLRSKQGRWCLQQVLPLAQLYALTGDIACAERAIWILEIAARRYPHWLFHSYDGTYADAPPGEVAVELGRHPRGGRFSPQTIITAFAGRHRDPSGEWTALFNGFWGAGRFGCSGGDAGMVLELTLAYELICDAIDAEAERRVREDLILAACDDMECWDEINNKCGPGRALSALVGRLFDRPTSVRRAIDGFAALLEKGFHLDGFCTESPSYSDMFLHLMRQIPDLLAGYSDPEDYAPAEGERIVDFDPYAHFERYRLALESMIRMLDPNLKYPVIGDTHAGGGLQPIHAEVLTAHYGAAYAGLLEKTLGAPLAAAGSEYALWHRDPDLQVDKAAPLPLRSEWFPGWQVGVLRGGEAHGHTAFYFNGYAQGGHRHSDTLGISYIAHGVEMAADRGYIWDDPRGAWTKGTLSHNIASVDGQKQNHRDRRSMLELFGRGPGVEIVQAAALAYEQCDLYRRTCALVQRTDGGTYAVDFFRLAGGQTHHYGFHCNGALVGIQGADFAALADAGAVLEEWSQWVERPRAARWEGPVVATWAHEGVHMDLHLLGAGARLLVADAPGWRSCDGSQLNAPPVQQILAERSGGASSYAAVMVPYEGADSPINGVRLIDCGDGALAVEVSLADRTDYIISAPDDAERTCGPVVLAGRFGLGSVAGDGRPLSGYLLAGTHLVCGDMECTLPAGHTRLPVAAVAGRTLQLAQSVAEEVRAFSHWALIGGTGYEIAQLAADALHVGDYPLVADEVVTLLHQRTWTR